MVTHLKSVMIAMFVACALCLANESAVAQDLSGNWRGNWQSYTNSHRGRLSAKFYRLDACHVQAKFRGTFFKVIPFRYKAVLNVVNEQPGMIQLSGSKRLPLSGTFSYDATISGNQFEATYSSKRDRGVWSMRRQ